MKFYIKDIPEPYPIWTWIRKHSDIETLAAKLQPSVDAKKLINLQHDINIDQLASTTVSMFNQYGFKGWKSSQGEDPSYGGLSLAMNPDYKEDTDLNQQTLGTEKNKPSEFFWNQIHNFDSVKNTYYDSYAFRKLSPCVEGTAFKDFVKGFKRSLIRSRLGVINAEHVTEEMRKGYGWHRDESVFENLRINIPIKTDESFMFEILGSKQQHLEYGNIYSWDTNVAHRVFPTTKEPKERIHIVLGFSPWFDYCEEDDSFVSNEFYGKMHPIDMLVQGHVHSSIIGYK